MTALFCPTCASTFVDCSGAAAGPAQCEVCGWTGTTTELVTSLPGGDEAAHELFRGFVLDLRALLARDFGVALGRLLVTWGFLDEPAAPRALARYLGRIAQAIAMAVVHERLASERGARSPSR
jgi:hypothetical protein